MAVILVLACSGFGFLSAVASFAFLDMSLIQALGIWSGFGLIATILGIAAAMLPGQSRTGEVHTA